MERILTPYCGAAKYGVLGRDVHRDTAPQQQLQHFLVGCVPFQGPVSTEEGTGGVHMASWRCCG